MSWDLSAFQTKGPMTSIDGLTEDDLVPLQRQQIMTELAVIATACDAQLDTNDPTWLLDLSKQSSFREWQQWRERALPKD